MTLNDSSPRPASAAMSVCIVSASGQNVFFAELLDAIATELSAAEISVERSIDQFPHWRGNSVYLFIPHEYLPLVEEDARPSPLHLSRSVVLCTEQPGTHWFEETAAIAAQAAGVVDINKLGARELRRRGVDAEILQLGYFEGWDTWHGNDAVKRPIDAVFMGGYTPRRACALAKCGRQLVDRTVALTLTESWQPHLADSLEFVSGDRRWEVLRRSKLMLNIHRSDLGYLEWLRVIGAILNGCVILTEHSSGFEPLVPGEHFISASYDRIPFVLDAALQDTDRLTTIRTQAYDFIREKLPLSMTICPLIELLKRVSAQTLEEGDAMIPAPVRPAPRRIPLPPTTYEQVFASRSDLDRVRVGIKDLLLGQLELRRQLATYDANSSEPFDTAKEIGPRDTPVTVSVLLTVYNYENVVGEAIRSVAMSDCEACELIVVDDCSRDNSLVTVEEELARHPWMPATIIARSHNQGLAAARNCAVEHARGELVFILDADNQIYPHALNRLSETLEDVPSAMFAYGIIEQFGPEGPCDLLSWRSWDPMRLRYGNYIDAMAMVRKSAVVAVGGYSLDRRLQLGWEDFELWCSFADRGWGGVLVPEILSRYRTGAYSMISITDIDTQAAWSALVERHRFLTA